MRQPATRCTPSVPPPAEARGGRGVLARLAPLGALALLLALGGPVVGGQVAPAAGSTGQPSVGQPGVGAPAVPASDVGGQTRRAVPWGVGERLTYEVKFGPVRVGSGSMEVAALESVRGREAYRTVFRVRGGTFFYKVDDVLESWMDTRTLESLRFHKDQDEGGRERSARFEIYPERGTFRQEGKPDEERTVADPLDEGSFLYFVRTLPLRDGDVYELPRYFRPDRNPVRIRVLRRERVKVPAGTFNAVVVQPTFKTKGIFSEGGRAEVWLSDDEHRMMLQMRSSLSFGTLNLFLRGRQEGQRLAGG